MPLRARSPWASSMTESLPASPSLKAEASGQLFWRLIDRCYEHQEVNLSLFSVMAIICFPLYYVVWEILFPQPYENLTLRLIGAAMWCAVLFRSSVYFYKFKFIKIFYYVTLIYSAPFFFTFMMLKNEMSLEWAVSNMAGIFLLIFLVDWLNLLIIFAIGSCVAWIAYASTTDSITITQTYLAQLAIYAFALAGGSILNYRAALFNKERVDTMLAVGGTIAHELRTPLLGIRSGADGLKRLLPSLTKAYRAARDAKLDVDPIRSGHLTQLDKVADRIVSETEYANMIIDSILINAGGSRRHWEADEVFSVRSCIDQAIERYPFKTENEKSLLSVEGQSDFSVKGSQIVLTHILFNLIKNSIFYVSAGSGDRIKISIEPGDGENTLRFWDNGSGIPSDQLRHVFDMFYTSGRDAGGTGMGLAFCRMAMDRFGGGISVRSEVGKFTELLLRFPEVGAESAR